MKIKVASDTVTVTGDNDATQYCSYSSYYTCLDKLQTCLSLIYRSQHHDKYRNNNSDGNEHKDDLHNLWGKYVVMPYAHYSFVSIMFKEGLRLQLQEKKCHEDFDILKCTDATPEAVKKILDTHTYVLPSFCQNITHRQMRKQDNYERFFLLITNTSKSENDNPRACFDYDLIRFMVKGLGIDFTMYLKVYYYLTHRQEDAISNFMNTSKLAELKVMFDKFRQIAKADTADEKLKNFSKKQLSFFSSVMDILHDSAEENKEKNRAVKFLHVRQKIKKSTYNKVINNHSVLLSKYAKKTKIEVTSEEAKEILDLLDTENKEECIVKENGIINPSTFLTRLKALNEILNPLKYLN